MAEFVAADTSNLPMWTSRQKSPQATVQVRRSKPSLAIYAPQPGSPSGIADYAVRTSRLLDDLFDIAFVSLDNYVDPEAFDHVLYHVGNGRHSAAAYRAAGQRPGPVILHEYVLSQFFIEHHDLLDETTDRTVREVFGVTLDRHYQTSSDLDLFMRSQRQLELHYLDLGLEHLVVDRATTVFTHSETSQLALLARYGSRVRLLDFPAEPLPASSRDEVRISLGIASTATVFGSFGFVGTNKRLPQLIRAWKSLNVDPHEGRLLIVGQGTSQLDPCDQSPVIFIEYVESAQDFATLLSTVDVGVQLRWPTLGETSGVVSQLLATNTPVILSAESIAPAWANRELIQTVAPVPDEGVRLAEALGLWLRNRPVGLGRRPQGASTWREEVLEALTQAERTIESYRRR